MVPRVIALVITLPLLTFFADIMGLAGGAVIFQFLLDVSPTQYLTRLPHVIDGSDLFVGLFKAPIFAFFIAIVGCMHGLRVSGSAESVGRKIALAGLPADSGAKFPTALSGGMVKRAAFARALALDPRILFLDEPTSNLEPIAASGIDALILQATSK